MVYRSSYVFGRSTLQGGEGTNLAIVRNEIIDSKIPDFSASIITGNSSSAYALIPPSATSPDGRLIGTRIPFDTVNQDSGNRLANGEITSTVPTFWADARPIDSTQKSTIRVDNKPYFAGNHLYDFSASIYLEQTASGSGAYLLEVAASCYTPTGLFIYKVPIWNRSVLPTPSMETTIDIIQSDFTFAMSNLINQVATATKIPSNLIQVEVEMSLAHTASASLRFNSAVLKFRRHREKTF